MSAERLFVDTNILIYAYDVSAGAKHTKAGRVVGDLWDSGLGVLSTQVLQEFFVGVTRKIPKPSPPIPPSASSPTCSNGTSS
jgi:predicted nucleic acid-binding protein